MTKCTLPTDVPSTERLLKANYFALADNLNSYIRRGTLLNESEREELEALFRSGPESPDPLKAYEPWEVESDFHEFVEALTGASCPASRHDLVELPEGPRELKARRTRGNGRSSKTWAEARVSPSDSPSGDNPRSSDARAPDAA